MSYAFYIDRGRNHVTGVLDQRILLEEWLTAVSQVPALRLAQGDLSVANPITGELVTVMRNHGGDVEMEVDIGRVRKVWQRDWRRVLFWSPSGRIMFSPDAFVDRQLRTDLRIPQALARSLNAQIRGESGELYVDEFLD